MVLKEDAGPPDEHQLASRRQFRARLRARLLVAVPVAIVAMSAGIAGLVSLGWPWWVLPIATGVVAACGMLLVGDETEPERPRPDTPLEVGCVVGVEIRSWGGAVDGRHQLRIIARPLGSAADQLVHGDRAVPVARAGSVRPGMLVGFRRHPTMRHLVWLEPAQDVETLVGLRTGRDVRPGSARNATVESISVTDDCVGDWWKVRITLRAEDGRRLTDVTHRLPEELAGYAEGSTVRVAPHQPAWQAGSSCSILPVMIS